MKNEKQEELSQKIYGETAALIGSLQMQVITQNATIAAMQAEINEKQARINELESGGEA